MIYRRQRTQYVFAIFLAVVAVVNVLFFFILTRPSQTEYADLQKEIETLDLQIKNSQKGLKDRERIASQLERFEGDKSELLMTHLVKRDEGYSEIQGKLNSILKKSGVKYTSIRYNLNPDVQAGLNAVSITVPVSGNYTNVVDFIRELETSDTFFLITAINLERTTLQEQGRPGTFPGPANSATAGGAVSLSLTLETFFYQ